MRDVVLTLVGIATVFGQSPPRAEFEVASIRPSSAPGVEQLRAGIHIDGAQVRGVLLSIKDYIGIAYKTKFAQISAPDWIGSARFDISATIPAGVLPGRITEMLQTLLESRFGLRVHTEKKELPVYFLVVGKGPLKLREVPPDADPDQIDPKGTLNASSGVAGNGIGVNLGNGSSYTFANNRFDARKLTMAQFSGNLERFADREIIDMTGVKGRYDFAFEVTQEDYRAMLLRAAVASGTILPAALQQMLDASSPAAVGDALQQIGLKLDPRKAPLDVLVVDNVQKTPTAN
jgi:uncharacterized protein (TIGR03435 family)